eukprot:TRINITY_DN1936_c0_g1_i8.p1 TRINITY_DN1936_c0_g1~~TRINITY_DN1936_c0_g1_i8.p1  ORF type:complete len:169 (-),score=16.93 TRINITY_DN1936_c0_g1_i8:14-520(-)
MVSLGEVLSFGCEGSVAIGSALLTPGQNWHLSSGTHMHSPQSLKPDGQPGMLEGLMEPAAGLVSGSAGCPTPPPPGHHWQVLEDTQRHVPQSTKDEGQPGTDEGRISSSRMLFVTFVDMLPRRLARTTGVRANRITAQDIPLVAIMTRKRRNDSKIGVRECKAASSVT